MRDKNAPTLIGLMVANALIAMDSTILATAVPTIVADVGDYQRFPWLFSIYLLGQAVTVPVYGKLADMFGRRPILLFGITTFMLASLLAGLAPSMIVLIIARAIQGIGAGAVGPMVMTLLSDIYSLKQRGVVQGYLASVWAVASVLGPALGGVFSQLDAWRWIFFLNIPLSLLAGFLVVRGYHEKIDRANHKIDFLGASVLTIGLTALTLGVLEGGNSWAWVSIPSLVIFAIGIIALIAFRFVEPHALEPIIEFGLLKRRITIATTITMAALGAVTTGFTSYTPSYLQVAAGLTPILAGFAIAPMTLGWPLTSSQSAKLYMTRGFKFTITLGSLIVLASSIALASTVHFGSAVVIAVLAFILGLGLGYTASPSTIAAQNSVGWSDRGQVTAINTFARSAGSSIGVAIFGAISNVVIASHGQNDAAANTDATQAIFIGLIVGALVMLVGALMLPRSADAHLTHGPATEE